MFDIKNIRAGYLVRCTALKNSALFTKGQSFFAHVTTAWSVFATKLNPDDEYLCVCWPEKWSAKLSDFNSETLTFVGTVQIDEVWSPANAYYAGSCDTRTRSILWKRDETRVLTLQEVEKALGYQIRIVCGKEPPKMKKPFGKSQLQPGMVVERRNGVKWVIAPSKEGLFLAGAPVVDPFSTYKVTTFTPSIRLDRYGEDLKWLDPKEPGCDIVRVWDVVSSPNYAEYAFNTNTTFRRMVWARDDRKPMTREELEKALGYPVLIVPETVDKDNPPKPIKM